MKSAPLSTTAGTQAWIYAFSAILPMICFIFVAKWPGIKYLKSNDEKAKGIGQVACAILAISTIITIWAAIVLTQRVIQSSVDSINADLTEYGL